MEYGIAVVGILYICPESHRDFLKQVLESVTGVRPRKPTKRLEIELSKAS
jgi:hypothetical protein